jgi:PhoPQ-activated pathogenicity-related protein
MGWIRGLALSLVLAFAALPAAAQETALDRYVHKADPAYGWKLVKTVPGDGVTTYVLELTSQTWRSAKDVDRPVWKHWLTIVKPAAREEHDRPAGDRRRRQRRPRPAKASDRTMRIATRDEHRRGGTRHGPQPAAAVHRQCGAGRASRTRSSPTAA